MNTTTAMYSLPLGLKRTTASFKSRFCRIVLHAVVLLFCSAQLPFLDAHAGGFRLLDQDPYASSRGNAYVARADRASAAYYNPAAMVHLEEPELHLGYHLVHLDADYKSHTSAKRSSNKSEFLGPPQFYAAYPFAENRLAFGFALYSPFGLGLEWPDDSGFRTLAKEAELVYLTASPTLAVSLHETFSIAAGVNVNYADLTLSQGLSPDPSSGALKAESDGTSVGFVLAASYRPNEQLAFGARYVSPSYVDMSGDTDLAGMSGDADARFAFPDFVTIGAAYKVTERLDIELNYDWTNWDRLNTLTFRNTPAGDIPLTLNYSSSSAVSLGGSYALSETWTLSSGYYFNENSVPTAHFNPAVPDLDKHYLNLGLSKEIGQLTLSCTYQYAFSGTRRVRGSTPSPAGESADGDYTVDIHALAAAVNYRL